jgi:anti-sigma factor RsiW
MNPQQAAKCKRMQKSFSGYLDQTISGREMQAVRAHLDACPDCTLEFAQWRGMQRLLAQSIPAQMPDHLGLQLRLAISRENTRRRSLWADLSTRWENLIRPAMLQTAYGLAGALLLFGGIAALVGVVPVANAVQAADEPLRAVTMPRYLYSSAHEEPLVTPDGATIVIEADINTEGKVYDYHIVSGPVDDLTRATVLDDLMLQVYEPARMFGAPVRGRVLVAFSGVLVKG